MAEVISIQSGTLAMNATSKTVAISAVASMDNCRLVYQVTTDSNVAGEYNVGGELDTASQLLFVIAVANVNTEVNWQLIEYASGDIAAQRGRTTITTTSDNITLTSVVLAATFVSLLGRSHSGSTFGSDDQVKLEMTTTTNLNIGREASATVDLYWEVVEYLTGADITVQRGENVLTSAATATPTITAVTLANSAVFGSAENGANRPDDCAFQLDFNSTTQLQIERNGSSASPVTVGWEVVEFHDGTEVQKGNISFGTTVLVNSATITAVNLSYTTLELSFGYGVGQTCGKTSYSADDYMGVSSFLAELTTTTNAQLTRGIHQSTAADCNYQVLEWNFSSAGGPIVLTDNMVLSEEIASVVSKTFEENLEVSQTFIKAIKKTTEDILLPIDEEISKSINKLFQNEMELYDEIVASSTAIVSVILEDQLVLSDSGFNSVSKNLLNEMVLSDSLTVEVTTVGIISRILEDYLELSSESSKVVAKVVVSEVVLNDSSLSSVAKIAEELLTLEEISIKEVIKSVQDNLVLDEESEFISTAIAQAVGIIVMKIEEMYEIEDTLEDMFVMDIEEMHNIEVTIQ